jgi:glycosyltransferase involved in cell wall biosynthesis
MFEVSRLRSVSQALLATLALSLAPMAWAQSGPVKVLVGFPPGGGTDAIARILADKLKDQLGVPVVSTDVGIARELLDADALGEVVPVADIDALAAAIVHRLSGAGTANRTTAVSAVMERFAPDRLIDGVVDVYRELW